MGAVKEALSWSNLTEQATDLGIGSGGNYFTIEEGENVVRVLTKPVHYSVYFISKGIAPIFAKNASDEVKTAHKPTHRFACYIYDNKTKKVQLAEFGWTVAQPIGELANSSQYSYDELPPFDIIITKTGSGMSTKYAVTPGRNEEKMTEAVLAELAEKQDIQEYLDEKVAKQAETHGSGDDPNATESEKEEAKKKA